MRAIGRFLVVVPAAALLVGGISCSSAPLTDPLQLDRGLVTVNNQTDDEWQSVEVWVNDYYRWTAVSIPKHSRIQAQLDTFVSGWGQRFNWQHAQITNLRVSAHRPTGEPVELKKRFQGAPLDEALRGTH